MALTGRIHRFILSRNLLDLFRMVKNHVEGKRVHLKKENNWMKCLKVFLVSVVNNAMKWKKGKKYLTTLKLMKRMKFAQFQCRLIYQ